MKQIENILLEYQDLKYQQFNQKLIPIINSNKIIGVRTPIIRKLAKELTQDKNNESLIKAFLNELPHKYQEENILHGIILTIKYKDINILLKKLDKFLKYADNWAITDIISPKIFKDCPEIVFDKVKIWINTNETYKVRFAIVTLLNNYLDDNFTEEIFPLINQITNEEYYVKMAISWFYSYALIKQYDKTIKYFENKQLDKWIHNKSIQKAIESYRIPTDQKEYLKTLKIK